MAAGRLVVYNHCSRLMGFDLQENEDARHVCVDGTTFQLEQSETLRCVTDDARKGLGGFYVYV